MYSNNAGVFHLGVRSVKLIFAYLCKSGVPII